MTEFGKTLREAREQKNLTISQIAETTHLLPQIVEDLENEDFHRISAPIYGRGFVKLYCEAVGLEPKPLVDEFMAILNGERVPAIKIRNVEMPPEEPVAPAAPEPPPAPVYTQPEFGDDAAPVAEVARQETRNEGMAPAAPEPMREPLAPPQAPRQYHPDYAQSSSAYGPSLNFARLAIVAGGAILVLVLLVLGIRALYRASMGISEEQEAPKAEEKIEEKVAEKPAAAKPASAKPAAKPAVAKKPAAAKPATAKPAVKRTPKSVPSLYID